MSRMAIFAVVLTCLTLGCASQRAIPEVQRTRLFNATYDTTWRAIIAVVGERSYPIQAIEKESGILATGPVALPDCWREEFNALAILPDQFLAVWTEPGCSINFIVTSEDESKTAVTVNTSIRVFDRNVTKTWHAAHSTGRIEEMMFDAIEGRLKPK